MKMTPLSNVSLMISAMQVYALTEPQFTLKLFCYQGKFNFFGQITYCPTARNHHAAFRIVRKLDFSPFVDFCRNCYMKGCPNWSYLLLDRLKGVFVLDKFWKTFNAFVDNGVEEINRTKVKMVLLWKQKQSKWFINKNGFFLESVERKKKRIERRCP